ncbi:hypothetical protein ART_3207 [Arthrobacter sp. PAMC 25486]|uniref:DUF3311 domain-containing protein n=1 Tax=Arthrobacter sp. PAMC 25486 TaxID=1494608 RepID=UPI000535B8D6|nr:DUF3311 domain-containing protein [Arthrobacter sp. PAMC 25486]AIY02806.1 hypothetical protein ART_3207 [Arthrobacter sp. PAMC 25486]
MSATNITHETPTRGPARPLPYVISGILLLAAVIFPLSVPMYAHTDPQLFGFPFFFWYQMMWVPICAILIGICYWLMTAEDKRRRAAVKAPPLHRGKHDAGGEPQ